jgi:hypothetical protein
MVHGTRPERHEVKIARNALRSRLAYNRRERRGLGLKKRARLSMRILRSFGAVKIIY